MATYVNDLRLKEIGTGESSGTWGTETNTNLELIGEALGYGTEAITTNADTHASTVADGSTDAARSMYIKYTGTLDSACTITIGPNTMSRVHIIENATSGSQNIIIKQGSGAEVTIPNGFVKAVYLDGAGSGAAVTEAFTDLSVGGNLLIDGTTPKLTIGDGGAEDTAIVFDGNAQDFYIGLDDSADDLIIGLGSTVGTTPIISIDENKDVAIPDGGLTITTDDNTTQLTLTSTDADASPGPQLDMVRDSGSPADSDVLGRIRFRGDNDAGEITTMVYLQTYLHDASDGTEDGGLDLFARQAGTLNRRITINTSGEICFNEDSADIDFRVESNGSANMLFVDGGNNEVVVQRASSGATATSGSVFIVEDDDNAELSILGGSSSLLALNFGHSGDADDGIITYNTTSGSEGFGFSVGGGIDAMSIAAGSGVLVNGAQNSNINFIAKAGSSANALQVDGSSGAITINEAGVDADFRIESDDTTHMVFFDAGGNSFNIDDAGAAGVRSTINKNSSGARVVSTGSYNHVLAIKNGNTANTIDRDATILWQVGGADEGRISWIHSDGTNSNNHGRFEIAGRNGGTRALMATFNSNVETVFNEGSLANQDFRIESDSYTHMWFLDSENNFTHWGNNTCNMTTNGWCIGATGAAHSVFSYTTTNEAFIWNNNNSTGTTYSIGFRQNNSTVGFISVGSSTTAYHTSSDYRLKTDVKDLENAVDRVNALRPRKFTWIKDGKEEEGFIAHEVQEVYPDAVEGEKDAVDEDGNMKIQVMDYGKITPLLAAGLQEAFKEIESLKQQVAELKGE